MLRKILGGFSDIVRFFIVNLPGNTGRKVRYVYYKNKFKRCGNNVLIDEGVVIQNPEWISVGDNVWIDKYCILMAGKVNLEGKIYKSRPNADFKGEEGELIIGSNIHIAPFCVIQAHGGVSIGNNCSFSSSVKLYSLTVLSNNPINPLEKTFFSPFYDKAAHFISPITLGNNVGIALNSTVMAGVTLGADSFVTINSVVFFKVPPNSYVSGNPAVRVKERFKHEGESSIRRVSEGIITGG